MIDHLQKRLADWIEAGLYREQHCLYSPMGATVNNQGNRHQVFCSNDYLGLANHPRMRSAMTMAAESHGVGSGASRLIVGHTDWHAKAEKAYAAFFGFDQALLFSSGYAANVGVIQALTTRDDVIYQDRLNHASLIDGARLSDAKLKRFQHLDYEALDQQLINEPAAGRLLVSDSVFSMRGDQADVSALIALKKKHSAALMIDDAHGVGVLGKHGLGALSEYSIPPRDIDVYVCPLGKAVGSFGAMVMGSNTVIDALRQFSRSYMYSTGIPAAAAACAYEALAIMQAEPERHQQLHDRIAFFKARAVQHGLPFLPSDTAIQALPVRSLDAVKRVSQSLLDNGFLVSAIRTPTVPAGQEQLRFTVTTTHDESDIIQLFDCLSEAWEQLGLLELAPCA